MNLVTMRKLAIITIGYLVHNHDQVTLNLAFDNGDFRVLRIRCTRHIVHFRVSLMSA